MDIPPELCLELLIAADYLDGMCTVKIERSLVVDGCSMNVPSVNISRFAMTLHHGPDLEQRSYSKRYAQQRHTYSHTRMTQRDITSEKYAHDQVKHGISTSRTQPHAPCTYETQKLETLIICPKGVVRKGRRHGATCGRRSRCQDAMCVTISRR